VTGALKQVAAAIRGRSMAFSFLIGQIIFGIMVVSHALVFVDLFQRQGLLTGVDMDGSFCVITEDDDTMLPERDLAVLQGLPGVRAAAWVSNAPVHERRLAGIFSAGERHVAAWEVHGTSAAADAYGFEIVRGRALTDEDLVTAGERPALISAALGEALFGAGDPVGRTFTSRAVTWRVSGVLRQAGILPPFSVVADNLLVQVARPARARHAEYVVNVAPSNRAGFPAAVESALRPAAPERFLRVETLRRALLRVYEATAGAIVVFGMIITLVLGVVLLGSTGMSAFLVAERLREIGIRRAMGATRRDIAGYFLFENFTVTTIGLILGSALSLVMNRWLVHLALPFATLDFRHLVLGIILFQVTGLLAATVPALRASRVPPSVASRTA
jgi:putative ABC transport system permease protein